MLQHSHLPVCVMVLGLMVRHNCGNSTSSVNLQNIASLKKKTLQPCIRVKCIMKLNVK